MKIIEKIEIKNFRSFGEEGKIYNLQDINIFSGANDSWKSNILRALNLFFHETRTDLYDDFIFDADFSRFQEDKLKSQKKAKSYIEIWILFAPQKSQFDSTVLPAKFWITKRFYRDGNAVVDIKDEKRRAIKRFIVKNKKTIERKESVQKAKTDFLKKINFQYIPAVKDKNFFDFLKTQYQDAIGKTWAIFDNNPKTLDEWRKAMSSQDITKLLDDKIKEESNELFLKFISKAPELKKANFNIPYLEIDYSSAIDIETDEKIPLKSRWDGVQAKFIPVILDEIATRNKEKPIVIWAFEEPENSYEYSSAQKLAEQFLDQYSKSKQIFITTHSFNFLSLKWEQVSISRVYKDQMSIKRNEDEHFHDISRIFTIPQEQNDLQGKLFELSHPEREKLENELWFYSLNEELQKIYQEKEKEKEIYIQKKKEIENLINKKSKVLFTEGPTDKIILEKAWKILFPDNQRNFEIIAMWWAGHLQNYIQHDFPQQNEKRVGIALFDFDKEWYEQWNGIKIEKDEKFSLHQTDRYCKKHKTLNICAILLSAPNYLKDYIFNTSDELLSVANLKLQIEHLFLKENDENDFLQLVSNAKKERGIYEIPKKKDVDAYKKKIESLPDTAYENFKPLFEKITTLFNNASTE